MYVDDKCFMYDIAKQAGSYSFRKLSTLRDKIAMQSKPRKKAEQNKNS